MKQRLPGRARVAVIIAQGEANRRCIGNAPAEISGERSIAKCVVRALALRFKIGNTRRNNRIGQAGRKVPRRRGPWRNFLRRRTP